MRTLSILQWAAIGGGVPLGGCLQKSGLPPLRKNRERKIKKERKKKKENCVIPCAVLSSPLVILCDTRDTSCV